MSSDDWDGDAEGEGAAILDESGICDEAQEFALKADDTGTLPGGGLVSIDGTTIDTGIITDESGNVESDNTLWLQLASTFDPDVYTGTITYSAV